MHLAQLLGVAFIDKERRIFPELLRGEIEYMTVNIVISVIVPAGS